jgi:cytochrome c biogenesis protein CcmG, thiol:disulfide interchange protein DsbE
LKNLLHKASIVAAFAVSISVLQACGPKATKDSEPTPVLSGRPNTTYPAPPLNRNVQLGQLGWDSAQGNHVTLAEYRDKVVVLDFYATWCAPCRESIPHLIDLEKRYGPRGLVVVGLNVGGPDDRTEVPAFARELNIHYELGYPDEGLNDVLLADSDAIPQTFVFDRQGRLVRRYVGFGYSTAADLEETLKEVLGG